MSPFEGQPHALYVPAGSNWSVTAETELELAVCSAPGGGDHPAQAIPPGTHPQIVRGKGSNVRHVTNIMPEDDGSAHSLLVVEVITPDGHTSSYPPHKHDRDDLPHESLLEETYYHRLNPPQGFAFQRVYTDDRSLDEAMAVEDGDVTLVPRGYHPCATCHGYDLYYLNVMAGPKRMWKFHNAEEHEWLLTAPDRRRPCLRRPLAFHGTTAGATGQKPLCAHRLWRRSFCTRMKPCGNRQRANTAEGLCPFKSVPS